MTPEERAERLELIKTSIISGKPTCGTCGRLNTKNFVETYPFCHKISLPVYGDNKVVSVDSILKSFDFYAKEHTSNSYPRHICKYCYKGVRLLTNFKLRTCLQIKKAAMYQRPKVFETVCYLCSKTLDRDKSALYFGKNTYERNRDEYLLAQLLRELCKRCGVEIMPRDIEEAWLCQPCHHQLMDIRNFKKETMNLKLVVDSIRSNSKHPFIRDPRLTAHRSKSTETVEWSKPKKITFASVEEINTRYRRNHIPQGLTTAVSLHRIPQTRANSDVNENQNPKTKSRVRVKFTEKEINDLLDSLNAHYVDGSHINWSLVMKDMVAKGYPDARIRYQIKWYKLKEQACACANSSTTPVLQRVMKLLKLYNKANTQNSNNTETVTEIVNNNEEERTEEMMVEPSEFCTVEMGGEDNSSSNAEKEKFVSQCEKKTEEEIREETKLKEDEACEKKKEEEKNCDNNMFDEREYVSLKDIEKIFNIELTCYKFNSCLREYNVVNEKPIVIDDEEDDDVIIVENTI